MASLTRMIAALALASLGGCATLTESNQQLVTVQTIQDNREIGGVGCILSNKAGRWFVTSPGRIAIQKSVGDLWIDCRKDGSGAGYDIVPSRVNPSGLLGNLVVSAGLGYFIDKNSGAGFDYPATLTVIMRQSRPVAVPEDSGTGGTVIY